MKKLQKTLTVALPLFLVICTCFACGKDKTMDTTQNIIPAGTTPDAAAGLQYLALGDSYTIGESVAESDRFPEQTVKLLAGDNISVRSINYIATTGWTTGNLINAISLQNPAHNYDVVTLLIGVNDQYQHVDTATYRTRFTALLNTAVTLAAGKSSKVFVVSIPDYSVTPFVNQSDKARVSREVDWFNAINKQVTLAYDIAYIDITPASREAATDPNLIANDGLHPSGKQYAKWAALLAPAVKNVLK